MPCYQIDGVRPVVDPQAYVHPTAVLIGDVIVSADCYVGPCAVLRGDFGPIHLEPGSNLQDTCVMHGFPGIETRIKANGHIGHGAVLHGCVVGTNSMVGMNSVVMDKAIIGDNSIVGAMAFIKADTQFENNQLILGSPAKAIRTLSEKEIEWKTKGTQVYQDLAIRSARSMVETTPLAQPEKKRKQISIDYQTLVEVKKDRD